MAYTLLRLCKPVSSLHLAKLPCRFLMNTYRENLDRYFASTEFALKNGQDSINPLRKAMESVYLRQKPLVCVDVEAWEKNNNKITEIGVAIYDPEGGDSSIFPEIKCIHILVEEHANMKNGQFVPDNKHWFMGGTSHSLRMVEARKFLTRTLHRYLTEREGVLVGHQVDGDVKWLRLMKVEIPDNLQVVDTLKLHMLSRLSGGALKKILLALQIPHGYLHNAANDAYYTLIVAMAYCNPVVRAANNLDVYEVLPPVGKGKRNRHNEKATVVKVGSGEELFEKILEKK